MGPKRGPSPERVYWPHGPSPAPGAESLSGSPAWLCLVRVSLGSVASEALHQYTYVGFLAPLPHLFPSVPTLPHLRNLKDISVRVLSCFCLNSQWFPGDLGLEPSSFTRPLGTDPCPSPQPQLLSGNNTQFFSILLSCLSPQLAFKTLCYLAPPAFAHVFPACATHPPPHTSELGTLHWTS